MTHIIGVIELSSKYRYGLTSRGVPIYLFRPYDETLPEFVVGCSHRDLTRNQIACICICIEANEKPKDKEKPRGNLVRLIGPVGDYASERAALLLHYCPHKKLAETLTVDESQDEQRMELSEATGWCTFHIDPPGCRDIDDAIAFHPTEGMAITIADAAAFIPPNSETDAAARAIGATFYNLDGAVEIPMLPATISEGQASLLPGQRRRGVTLLIANGHETFRLSWITVQHSFTYDTVMHHPIWSTLTDTFHGADSHQIVETLMIRYNAAAARVLKAAGAGLLRVQPEGKAWANLDPNLAFLANEAASYQPASAEGPHGHAGLGLEAYCHASSPIRRYADLANQRILKSLSTVTPHELAEHLNDRTRANRRWTRDLTFLTQVTPGKVHTLDVVWVDDTQVWVPLWKRLLRLRHEQAEEPGYKGRIQIFCDPTQRNWKRRVLTARWPNT